MSEDVKTDPVSTCPEFEDLSPDSRMQYEEQLDAEIAALQQKRDTVRQIQQADPIDRTLLVKGLHRNRMPDAVDFAESFKVLRAQQGRFEGVGVPSFSGVEVLHEKNCKFQDGAWLKVEECYIRLRSIKEARFLEQLPEFDLIIRLKSGSEGFRVRFVRPSQDDETRKAFNKIGGLVERLQAVKKELSKFEFGPAEGRPVLSNRYVDKISFKNQLEEWKKKRSSALPLNRAEMHMVSWYVPVELKSFRENFNKLWDEQCDLMLELQLMRCDGFDFEF